MPRVSFFPSAKVIEVARETSLFNAALKAGLPVASSCGEQAICAKCNMQILKGSENLSPPDEWEKKLLKKENCDMNDRISCQTKILGNCTVTTSYW